MRVEQALAYFKRRRDAMQLMEEDAALCKKSTCTLADLINLYAAVVGVPSTC